MENKFKVGDRVVLATDFEIGKRYNGITLTESMVSAFHDKEAIVEAVSDSTPFRDSNNKHYCIMLHNDYAYGVDMLEYVPNSLDDIFDKGITCIVNVSSAKQTKILCDICSKFYKGMCLDFTQIFNERAMTDKYENGVAFSFYKGEPQGYCYKRWYERHERMCGKLYNFEDLYAEERRKVKMNKQKRIKELRKQIEEINAEINELEQGRDDTLEEYEHGIYQGYDGYTLNDYDCVVKDNHPTFNPHDYNPYRHYMTKEYANKAFKMKRFNDMLMAFKWCYDRDYEPDWTKTDAKYCVAYNNDGIPKQYCVEWSLACNFNTIHFSSRDIAYKCADWLNTIDPDGELVV